MTRWLMRAAFALAVVTVSYAQAADGNEPRVGWEETFQNIDRWIQANQRPTSGTPLVKVEPVDGGILLQTACGALSQQMRRPDWPDWPQQPASGFTRITIDYEDEVDFDRYPYVVAHTTEKGVFCVLSVNGRMTKVLYTTGVHAQDLRTLGLNGRQKVSLSLQFLNSSNWIKIKSIRLVSQLNEQERQGFIDEGIVVRPENQRSIPYHGLEALNARAGRPIRLNPVGGEWCVFHDSGTGAEVWKMTASPGDEHGVSFNRDGSAFTVRGRTTGGYHIYDWTTGQFILMPGGLGDAAPRFSSVDPDSMIVARQVRPQGDQKRRIMLYRVNFRTGEETEIINFETDEPHVVYELVSSHWSSKMLFGFRETPTVMLLDPDAAEESQKVRKITLPTRLKGVSFGRNENEITWFNCYTYEAWKMDLTTGQVNHLPVPEAGGHSIGGPEWTIGPYSNLMKLLVRNGLDVQTEQSADDVRIWANLKEPLSTDYGAISRDGRWAVTDGDRGDVAGQHLLIDINDPGTVLRACFHHTSRNDWVTNTYSYSSPDATKIAWISDQFDDGDIYMVVTTRPKPPTDLKAARKGGAVELTWSAPADTREIAGYRIYRSTTSGHAFVALNDAPVTQTTFTDADAPGNGPVFYMVALVEPSGLEGHFSVEAAVDAGAAPRTLLMEAELGRWSSPMRQVLRGEASGTRYLRMYRASEKEPISGSATYALSAPAGRYALWLRARAEDDEGTWSAAVGENALGEVRVQGRQFAWVRLDRLAELPGGDVELTLSTTAVALAVDQIVLSSDERFDPREGEWAMTAAPSPAKNVSAGEVSANSVKLTWQPSDAKNIARYDIHVGDAPKGNATIIGSTRGTEFEDWGLKPGTKYVYHVVAVDSRGVPAEPVRVEVTTAQQEIQITGASPEGAGLTYNFPVEVKEDGQFMLWAQYSPAYVRGEDFLVDVAIDGQPAGRWMLRAPYRPMWWTLAPRGGRDERTFTDKIVADGEDVFALTKGRHTITIRVNDQLADNPHKMLGITISSDMSFRPEGYDPRANFVKESRRR